MQAGVGGLRDAERFGPWVYQVARSALADHGRARARHPLPGDDAAGGGRRRRHPADRAGG